MKYITSDPDYTGYPLAPGTELPWWQLTRDQWYVITRILYREHIRGHMVRDPSGQKDPDSTERDWIHQRVRSLLLGMLKDPSQTWSRINWSTRIPWNKVACYGYWSGSGGDVFMSFQQWSSLYGSCPSEVVNDLSYQSGLASYEAPLDPIEPWSDIYDSDIYESECDAIYNEVFSGVQATPTDPISTASQGAGAGWTAQSPQSDTSMSTVGKVIVGAVGVVVAGVLTWLGIQAFKTS